MSETIIIFSFVLVGSVALCWFIMNKKIKETKDQLTDKQVVIKELANYAEKITQESDNVIVKKTKKPVTKKPATTSKKETKKVEPTKLKRGRKPKQN